ncbi:HNH endonuclease [Ralstonia solanacearum]
MPDITKRMCIYCNIDRPFTDEHVFPAGLGGDDRRYPPPVPDAFRASSFDQWARQVWPPKKYVTKGLMKG